MHIDEIAAWTLKGIDTFHINLLFPRTENQIALETAYFVIDIALRGTQSWTIIPSMKNKTKIY